MSGISVGDKRGCLEFHPSQTWVSGISSVGVEGVCPSGDIRLLDAVAFGVVLIGVHAVGRRFGQNLASGGNDVIRLIINLTTRSLSG
jgi:hypothetical protein